MEVSLQGGLQAAQAAPLDRSADLATPLVKTEEGPGLGVDFQNVLEGFRKRADTVEASGRAMLAPPGAPETANQKSVRQLTELYTYAVDMQLMVRTSGQLTSGLRQLITGQ